MEHRHLQKAIRKIQDRLQEYHLKVIMEVFHRQNSYCGIELIEVHCNGGCDGVGGAVEFRQDYPEYLLPLRRYSNLCYHLLLVVNHHLEGMMLLYPVKHL